MGGKAHADNQQVVNEQKKQAEDAAAKESARQDRLVSGLKQINYAFNGAPVYASTAHNFTADASSALPAGYTRVQVDAQGRPIADTPGRPAVAAGVDPAAHRESLIRAPRGGGSVGTVTLRKASAATPATPAPTSVGTTMIRGPDGSLHRIGENIAYTSSDPTGATSGGFDDNFYNNYRDSITDYYDPQVADQYKKATDELTYRLARAGTGDSSAGNTQVAELAKQNSENLAGLGNKADQAVGVLRGKIAGEQQKATSQLYATENPDVAANQALAAVRDISLQQPDMSPLAQLFNIAQVGGANIMKNIQNQNFIGKFQGGLPSKQGSGTIVGA